MLMVLWFCGSMGFMILEFYGFMDFVFYSCMALRLYGYMVSWFYSFITLWFYGVMVLSFRGFIVLVVEKHQNSITCFQKDIDLISKIVEILLNRFPSFPGAHPFQNSINIRLPIS